MGRGPHGDTLGQASQTKRYSPQRPGPFRETNIAHAQAQKVCCFVSPLKEKNGDKNIGAKKHVHETRVGFLFFSSSILLFFLALRTTDGAGARASQTVWIGRRPFFLVCVFCRLTRRCLWIVC
ncbi:hypothetical protein TW95_gp0848 [Pandoravirus inopinatum]|uniref:Uncharacterized protein n=1 Tax=Pandoravirus inopinatum TaxID=1605721 RepID=A0A0B5JD22_9VIRU|nr:hypothetical protein TW95_gp0848 [Pandoravirus inopinatum]AJF97582.1 hypothetical protein [Pandoravirus inopinatum]